MRGRGAAGALVAAALLGAGTAMPARQQPGSEPSQPAPQSSTMSSTESSTKSSTKPSDSPAPQAAQQPGGSDDEIRLASELVVVPVSANREDGGPAKDMAQADFALAEDGAAQEIGFFRRDEVPLDAVLLVDASASADASLDVIRRAASEFAKQLRQGDRLSVVAFADRPTILLDWTGDRKAISDALGKIEPKGNTVLYGSVVAALHERYENLDPERRRAMIVLTDGDDTLSSVTSRTAAQAALRRDVTIYAVSTARIFAAYLDSLGGVGSPAERARRRQERDRLARAEEPLAHLAEQTGGRVLYPRDVGQLPKSYASVAEELRSRYLLGYYPRADAPDGFHAISVTTARRGVALRARSGYYKGEPVGRE